MRSDPPSRLWRAAVLALGVAALAGAAAQAAIAAPMFDVQVIANPARTDFCEPLALTDAQGIVARCGGTGGGGFHRTLPGPWQAIPPPPGYTSSFGIEAANNAGTVIGTHPVGSGSKNAAYIWSEAGGYQYLTRATRNGYMSAHDISDAGVVVGQEGHNAMIWNADGSVAYRDPTNYGLFVYSRAYQVNSADEVIAHSDLDGYGLWTATQGPEGVYVDGRRVSTLADLNNAGQLVGAYTFKDAERKQWFQRVRVDRDGSYVPVGAAERNIRFAWHTARLNDAGQVIYLVNNPNLSKPDGVAYWDEASGAHELVTLINPASPLAGRIALSSLGPINNLGQILLSGTDTVTGERQLYLFTPMTP